MTRYSVVVPTVGRPSLTALLERLATDRGPEPEVVVLVHDRPGEPLPPLPPGLAERLADRLAVVPGPGRGPAAARNVGWRRTWTPWVVFLDDDVLPAEGWRERLAKDLAAAGEAAGVQGRIEVPPPVGRRPTDWERQVAGLAGAPWITADIAYRRAVLSEVDGFDERFPAAYREDTDLALRVLSRGHFLVQGERRSLHPVRPAPGWVSVARQRGNADDALMRRIHGPRWRNLANLPPGRRRRHAAVVVAGFATVGAAVLRHRRVAAVAGLAWLAGTAEFAAGRIRPGPGTPPEVFRMLWTSAAIPPVAVAQWLLGWLRHRGARPHEPAASA